MLIPDSKLIMKIILNGNAHYTNDSTSIQTLLEKQGFKGKRIAVEVNQEIIPRSLHIGYLLHEGDQIEIVHAIGGG